MKKFHFIPSTRYYLVTFIIFTLANLLLPTLLFSAESLGAARNTTRNENWSLLGGYGISHKDLGKTKAEVQVIDLIPRYEKILFRAFDTSWHQGYHALLVELPVTWVFDPDSAPMIGVNFLGAWTFTASRDVQPYCFGGGGILYTDANIPGLGSRLNGNWQFGAGARFNISTRYQVHTEYRFHHISNTGAKDPNDPINSSKFLVGITF